MAYNKKTWANGDLITKESMNNIENGISDAHVEIEKIKNNTSSGTGITDEQATQLTTAYQHSQSTHAPSNAEANVQVDWNVTDTNSDAYIKNKPTNLATTDQLPTVPTKTSQLTNDSSFATETYVNNKIAEASLSGGEVDLSGYVTKETGNANQITFSDGQTFQAKLDAGTLKGDKGDKGDTGATGPQGPQGPQGDIGSLTDEQVATAISNYLQQHPIDGSVDALVDTIPDNNLIDFNNLVTSFTNSDGGTTTGTFTNYIKIKAGQRYVTNLNYTQFYFFDANKNHTSTQTYLSYPQVISGNGGYILIKLSADYSESKVLEGTDIGAYKPEHIKLKSSLEDNKWYGKKWLCIGDSISTDEANLAKNGYAKLISRELGMTLTNISVSGKTMKDGYEWLDDMSDEFDLITVMLGTNNQGYNCALGSLNDSYYTSGAYNSNNSFYAQTQLMAEKLKTKFPKSIIIFLTPIKRTGCGDDAQHNDENGYFKKLATTKEYRDVIIDVCNYYSLPYIDLYNCIDPRIEENRTLYFTSATDGTHPNDLGHAMFLAPAIKNGIVKQCPYYFNDWTVVETYGNIVTDVSELSVSEGNSNTFTVSLDKAPTNEQIVNIASNNADVTVSPTTLTFTSENYNTSQTVTVNAAEDDDTVNDVATITLSSNGVTSKTITITVVDNDEPVTTTTYTVTNNLTNVTTSNSATSVDENSAYSATLTADTGYTLDTVTVTMGGEDITSTVYSDGVITIASVTGNISITCTATATEQPSDGAILIHSYDMSTMSVGDTTIKDNTNNFDLSCTAVVQTDVDNAYYSCTSNKTIISPRNSNFILGGDSKDFTLAINMQAKDSYCTGSIHTGYNKNMNITNTDFPDALGRFIMKQASNSGAIATGINFEYYSSGNSLSTQYSDLYFSQTYNDVHIIRFKLDTLTVQIDRFLWGEDTGLKHDFKTITLSSGLRFDGICVIGNLNIKKINLYSGFETDNNIEVLAKSWLGLS